MKRFLNERGSIDIVVAVLIAVVAILAYVVLR